jgi:hypothetical protein
MTVAVQEVMPLDFGPGVSPHEEKTVAVLQDVPRPGSRAERMRRPMAGDVLKVLAEANNVCAHPMAIRRLDEHTGEVAYFDAPCGATLEAKCKPCATKNKILRQQQIREGWFLTDEPMPPPDAPSGEVEAAVLLRCTFAFEREQAMRASQWGQVTELDQAIRELDETLAGMPVRGTLRVPSVEKKERKARSTKRRADAVDLPRLAVENRTVGKVYVGKDGTRHQPSTLITFTLPSYGAVHGGPQVRRGNRQPCECGVLHSKYDPLLGTPIDPDTYDYRQAALGAVHYPKVIDRFWQNFRRAVGWNVQYAGTVEMQKRLAPHGHYAMRGTAPKKFVKQVAEATFHQVWWPHFGQPVYGNGKLPVWDEQAECYRDPKTGEPLTTFGQACAAIGPDDEPAFVARLGGVKADGITPGSKDADRSVKYITKYITKDLTSHAAPSSDAQLDHFNRLHAELSVIPCAPTCANWLLYAIQPDKAKKGLIPGRCKGKVHQRSTLGYTGRRVLVSRQWSGKTLADHRYDQRAWVKAVLSGALDEDDTPDAVEKGRYSYRIASPDDPAVPHLQVRIMQAIAMKQRWKHELRQALPPPESVSANKISKE